MLFETLFVASIPFSITFCSQQFSPLVHTWFLSIRKTPTCSLGTEQGVRTPIHIAYFKAMSHFLKYMPCRTSHKIMLSYGTCQLILPPHKTLAAYTSYKYRKRMSKTVSIDKL
jgi:hypothetical protein